MTDQTKATESYDAAEDAACLRAAIQCISVKALGKHSKPASLMEPDEKDWHLEKYRKLFDEIFDAACSGSDCYTFLQLPEHQRYAVIELRKEKYGIE